MKARRRHGNSAILSNKFSQSNLKANNIFLQPSSYGDPKSNFSPYQKNLRQIPQTTTFSDYSTDTFFDTSQSMTEKNNEDSDNSSYNINKKSSTQSINTFHISTKTNSPADSSNLQDDSSLGQIKSLNQIRKGNSHQSIQSYGINTDSSPIKPISIDTFESSGNLQQKSSKPSLLSMEIRKKINSKSAFFKTYVLITKRKSRGIGKTAHYLFTDGENTIFNIYQRAQNPNIFEFYLYNQEKEPSTIAISTSEKATNAPNKNLLLQTQVSCSISKSQSCEKSIQIQTEKSITPSKTSSNIFEMQNTALTMNDISKSPIAILEMNDPKGREYILYKPDKNGQVLLKVKYEKTNYTGYYRSTTVTFHKSGLYWRYDTEFPVQLDISEPFSIDLSSTSSSLALFNDPTKSHMDVKQRLFSKQPPINDEGNPAFVNRGGKIFSESIRNMDLCKKYSDKIYISIRKTYVNEMEIDTFFKADLLWLAGIAISDETSAVY